MPGVAASPQLAWIASLRLAGPGIESKHRCVMATVFGTATSLPGLVMPMATALTRTCASWVSRWRVSSSSFVCLALSQSSERHWLTLTPSSHDRSCGSAFHARFTIADDTTATL